MSVRSRPSAPSTSPSSNHMNVNRQPHVLKSWVRLLLIISGTICVGLGILGMFLPLLPTTPFLLLAAACYGRSSQRLYNWLLYNRWFGKYIRSYTEKKGIPLKIKIYAVILLWVAIGISAVFAVDNLIARIILMMIALGVTTHLVLVPNYKE